MKTICAKTGRLLALAAALLLPAGAEEGIAYIEPLVEPTTPVEEPIAVEPGAPVEEPGAAWEPAAEEPETQAQPSAFDDYQAQQPVRPMRNQRVFGDEDDIPDAPAQPAARRNYNNDVPAFLRRNKK